MKYEIAYTFLDLAITPHYTDTVTQAQLLRPVITPDWSGGYHDHLCKCLYYLDCICAWQDDGTQGHEGEENIGLDKTCHGETAYNILLEGSLDSSHYFSLTCFFSVWDWATDPFWKSRISRWAWGGGKRVKVGMGTGYVKWGLRIDALWNVAKSIVVNFRNFTINSKKIWLFMCFKLLAQD